MLTNTQITSVHSICISGDYIKIKQPSKRDRTLTQVLCKASNLTTQLTQNRSFQPGRENWQEQQL